MSRWSNYINLKTKSVKISTQYNSAQPEKVQYIKILQKMDTLFSWNKFYMLCYLRVELWFLPSIVSGGSRIFLGGANFQSGSANLFFAIFCWKLHKKERTWTLTGHAFLVSPMDLQWLWTCKVNPDSYACGYLHNINFSLIISVHFGLWCHTTNISYILGCTHKKIQCNDVMTQNIYWY